jgi:hypothetical protein
MVGCEAAVSQKARAAAVIPGVLAISSKLGAVASGDRVPLVVSLHATPERAPLACDLRERPGQSFGPLPPRDRRRKHQVQADALAEGRRCLGP